MIDYVVAAEKQKAESKRQRALWIEHSNIAGRAFQAMNRAERMAVSYRHSAHEVAIGLRCAVCGRSDCRWSATVATPRS